MAGTSNIEWTDCTWNPIVGCSIVSPGCTNCYAMTMAARLEAINDAEHEAGRVAKADHYHLTTKKVNGNVVWTGKVALAPDHIITAPLRWRKPRRIFVNSMGDLFHESIPDEWIDRVFAVMALARQHTFQVLTKRAERMRDYFMRRQFRDAHPLEVRHDAIDAAMNDIAPAHWCKRELEDYSPDGLPLPNVWLGVSAERQTEWDERKEHLRATPAAIRFASFEPLLGPITCDGLGYPCDPDGGREPPWLDWAIVGGESGPNARPMHPDWARSLRDQCQAAGVPFFFKQFGEWAWGSNPEASGEHRIIFNDGQTCGFDLVASRAEERERGWVGREPHCIRRVGKRRAGRLLDGRTHDAFPEART